MKPIHERINQLLSHRFKHKLGMHDQREHGNWSKGPGMYGGGGGGLTGGEQIGPFALHGVQFSQDKPNRGERVKRQRTERLASIPVVQQQAQRAMLLRAAAIKQQEDYNRRHRMRSKAAKSQGIVSPSAMHSLPYGSFFEVDTPTVEQSDANLFQDPRKIVGLSPIDSQETNLYDFVNSIYDKNASELEEYLTESGRFTEKEATDIADEYFQMSSTFFEAVMRKSAASFAADFQGFFGGEIYSDSSPEYVRAMNMSRIANQTMGMIPFRLRALRDKINSQLRGESTEEFDSLFTFEKLKIGIDSFAAKQIENSPVDVRKLMPINSALVSDIIERARKDVTSVSVSPKTTPSFFDIDAPILPLQSLYAFMHPDIQNQILRIAKAKQVKYPSIEKPSTALKILPMDLYGKNSNFKMTPAIRDAVDIFSSVVDELHTDGGLHSASVIGMNNMQRNHYGGFAANAKQLSQENYPDTGNPYIVLNANRFAMSDDEKFQQMSALSALAHEFGHLIDYTAFTFGEKYWSDAQGLFDNISSAGGPSGDFPSKTAMAPFVMNILNRWTSQAQPSDMESLDYTYLSQPREVFARLYEQFVMDKVIQKLKNEEPLPSISGTPATLAQLAKNYEDVFFGKFSKSLGYFNREAFNDSLEDLKGIFAVMGWKIK